MGRRKKGRPVSGWLILDKPYDMGSTAAVAKAKWLFQAQKAGHAGTLDPLASGMLPIAFGEATKTVPYVVDGEKSYDFTIRWGQQTNTDDAEGDVIQESDNRPSAQAVAEMLENFTGIITQVPPQFSAVKVDGKRAYAQARAGEDVKLSAREVEVTSLVLRQVDDDDHARFTMTCGKGTYVRALARDLAIAMGCYGHVSALRRLEVYPFSTNQMVSLDDLLACEGDVSALDDFLLSPIEALSNTTHISVSEDLAHRISVGNAVLIRDRTLYDADQDICAVHKGELLAIGRINGGLFHPKRVLNQGL